MRICVKRKKIEKVVKEESLDHAKFYVSKYTGLPLPEFKNPGIIEKKVVVNEYHFSFGECPDNSSDNSSVVYTIEGNPALDMEDIVISSISFDINVEEMLYALRKWGGLKRVRVEDEYGIFIFIFYSKEERTLSLREYERKMREFYSIPDDYVFDVTGDDAEGIDITDIIETPWGRFYRPLRRKSKREYVEEYLKESIIELSSRDYFTYLPSLKVSDAMCKELGLVDLFNEYMEKRKKFRKFETPATTLYINTTKKYIKVKKEDIDNVGLFIGKGGKNIKNLQQKAGVKIKLI